MLRAPRGDHAMTTFDLEPAHTTSQSTQAPSAAAVEHGIAGWFGDPRQEHRLRYFNGEAWTSHVTHAGPLPCTGCR